MTDGLVTKNVAKLTKPPHVPKAKLRVFTQAQAIRFVEGVRGHRLQALFIVAIACALREGEILGLHWDDIDFEQRKLTVCRTLQRVKLPGEKRSRLRFLEPKNEGSNRTVILPAIAASALAERARQHRAERELCGSCWNEHNLVFPTTIGTPLDQRSMLRHFYLVLKTSGLPRIRFHDLRHSAVALLIAQGTHPKFIMELLGHSSIKMTMDVYGHLYDELKRETANNMDTALEAVAVNIAVKAVLKQPN